MADDEPLVQKDTAGHEADRLLRTVARAFYSDTCSIVLDVVLRNHYATPESEVVRLLTNKNQRSTGVDGRRVRHALQQLLDGGLLDRRKRLPVQVQLEKYKAPQQHHTSGFTKYHFDQQRKGIDAQEEFEQNKQRRAEDFYYVRYPDAVRRIRYRLYELLHDESTDIAATAAAAHKRRAPLPPRPPPCADYYECVNKHRVSQEVAMRCVDMERAIIECPECGERLSRVRSEAVAVRDENARRADFQRALQPLINALAPVLKHAWPPEFAAYTPAEQLKLKAQKKEEDARKRRVAGYVDDVVNVEESLERPPGALDKSSTVMNGTIPWLARSSFFDDTTAHPTTTIVARKAAAAHSRSTATANTSTLTASRNGRGRGWLDEWRAPAAKRARLAGSSDDVEEDETQSGDDDDYDGAAQAGSESESEQQRAAEEFDQQLQDVLDRTAATPADQQCGSSDEEPDTGTPNTNSSSSSSSNSNSSSGGTAADCTHWACQGFDKELLGAHLATVRGVQVPLAALTAEDVQCMTDEEYCCFAHVLADIAGVC